MERLTIEEPPQTPTGSTDPSSGILAGYAPVAGGFDEMVDSQGKIRPHWQAFAQRLASLPSGGLQARAQSIQRLLSDHGVTYNIYSDTPDSGRPWALDHVPFIVDPGEFEFIERGLQQRARLLEMVLADVYGSRRLLREGWIPPALMYANPGFLRAAQGGATAGGAWLTTIGTDLVRAVNGRWMVLADRTQAPSGIGYTLENRVIISKVLADEFNTSRVQRLTAYHDAEHAAFRERTPSRRGTPTVVMLTPGPYNETYFEHAFQARHMGFPLVEGADLTVRDRRVHLKTLEGLRRVDVIVRRVDDVYCDPLELRDDTWLGVPGLAEAWRSGNVAIINALGTGAVETPALHPFMPGLCRHLLGEELMLPCVPTWWCGQQRELNMVMDEPERWVIKRAFSLGSRIPLFLCDLNEEQRAEAMAQVQSEPHAWVAQEMVRLSTTPTCVDGALQPRCLVWRAFTLATGGDSHLIMPGGLSRVSSNPERFLITMQQGGVSKDTWVMANGAVLHAGPRQAPVVVRPARPPSGVPSRAADHLFWLGRYAERLEQKVRVLRTVLSRLAGEQSDAQRLELEACQHLLARMKMLPPEQTLPCDDHTLWSGLVPQMTLPNLEDSLPDLLNRLRFNASAARDRLSDDTWRLFNRLDADAQTPGGALYMADAQSMLDTLVLDLAAFSGMQLENMTRGHGWRFLELGRRIERAFVVLDLAAACAAIIGESDSILTPLLEICDSSMTYRRLHFARPNFVPALDLILLNESNPRSLAFQLHALGRQATHLPHDTTSKTAGREKSLTDALESETASVNLHTLMKRPEEAPRVIGELCARLQALLEQLSDSITEHYFSHALKRGR